MHGSLCECRGGRSSNTSRLLRPVAAAAAGPLQLTALGCCICAYNCILCTCICSVGTSTGCALRSAAAGQAATSAVLWRSILRDVGSTCIVTAKLLLPVCTAAARRIAASSLPRCAPFLGPAAACSRAVRGSSKSCRAKAYACAGPPGCLPALEDPGWAGSRSSSRCNSSRCSSCSSRCCRLLRLAAAAAAAGPVVVMLAPTYAPTRC